MTVNPTHYGKSHPFPASIKDRYRLTHPDSSKSTHHIVLDLESSGFTYQVGDCLAIFPDNDLELVNKTLEMLRATGEETVADKQQQPWNLFLYLQKKMNITEVSRKFVGEVAARQTRLEKKVFLENLLLDENKEAFREYQAHHALWQILEKNREVEFSPQELCNLMMPLLPRFYSIASSQAVVGNEVHLTVALLKYDASGQVHKGVCTHYLCEIAPVGQPVIPVYIHPHHGFTLPENDDVPMIMIGPGTGVAPFRAFMQERVHRKASGKNWLFFGECHQSYDFFYSDFWEQLVQEGKLRLNVAFSRDQDYKVYVQHRMLENAPELYRWLEEGAYLYVCGDAHHMAKDVEAALHLIIQEQGGKSEQEAKAYVKELRASKRYLRDVY